MAHSVDPQLQEAATRMMAMAAQQGVGLERAPASPGDWRTRRTASEAALAAWRRPTS